MSLLSGMAITSDGIGVSRNVVSVFGVVFVSMTGRMSISILVGNKISIVIHVLVSIVPGVSSGIELYCADLVVIISVSLGFVMACPNILVSHIVMSVASVLGVGMLVGIAIAISGV